MMYESAGIHEAAARRRLELIYHPPPPAPPTVLLAMSPKGTPSRRSSPTLPNIAVNELPPLPEIRSEQLWQRIFTHSSLSGGHKHPFQAPDGTASADNEE